MKCPQCQSTHEKLKALLDHKAMNFQIMGSIVLIMVDIDADDDVKKEPPKCVTPA